MEMVFRQSQSARRLAKAIGLHALARNTQRCYASGGGETANM